MVQSVKALVEAANQIVEHISAEQAKEMIDRGEAVVIDVREPMEVGVTGKVPGAINIPRGLLEFKADPDAPTHEPRLDKDKTVILYCAAGGRAALAGQTLKQFGYKDVRNMGGFNDWDQENYPVEPRTPDRTAGLFSGFGRLISVPLAISKSKSLRIEQMRRPAVAQPFQHVLLCPRSRPLPIFQQGFDPRSLQAVLRAAEIAGNDREAHRLRKLGQIRLRAHCKRPQHEDVTLLVQQLGRHGSKPSAMQEVHQKGFQHVFPVMPKHDRLAPFLPCDAVEVPPAQAGSKANNRSCQLERSSSPPNRCRAARSGAARHAG
jgi:rhodanese-related sulfurtransferase